MKISNETKVGILATFAIVIVILGINFLKGKNVLSRNITLYAKYEDVGGLGASNPVILHGLKVGQVDNLELIKEGKNNIMVKFHIGGDVEIPKDTKAKIISSDLLGSKAIELTPGRAPTLAERNDTLPGYVEPSLTESINKVVAPVKDKVERLIGSVDTVVNGLNEVFNDDTKKNLRFSFRSLRGTLDNIEVTTGKLNTILDEQSGRVKNIMANVEDITHNIKTYDKPIRHAIENFAAISDTVRAMNLKHTVEEANAAVASLNATLSKIEKGQGSIGKLVNDDKLYNNLQAASKNLDKLVFDLRANPGRYLNLSIINFGRRDKHNAYQEDTAK